MKEQSIASSRWVTILTILFIVQVETTVARSMIAHRAAAAAERNQQQHHGRKYHIKRALRGAEEEEENAHHVASNVLGLNTHATWYTEVESGDMYQRELRDADEEEDSFDYTLRGDHSYYEDREEDDETISSKFQNFYLRRSDTSDSFMADVVAMSPGATSKEAEDSNNGIEEARSTYASWLWGSTLMHYIRGGTEDSEDSTTTTTQEEGGAALTDTASTTTIATNAADTSSSKCGDGQVDDGEECDDGAALNGKPGHPCKMDCTSDHYVFDLSVDIVNEDVEFYLVSGSASSLGMIDVLEDVGMLQDELRDRYDVGDPDETSSKPVLGSGHPANVDPNYTLYEYLDPAHCHRFVFWDEHVANNDGLQLLLKIDGAVVYDDATYKNNFEEGSSGGVKFGNCGGEE